jgi:hypothetical protein
VIELKELLPGEMAIVSMGLGAVFGNETMPIIEARTPAPGQTGWATSTMTAAALTAYMRSCGDLTGVGPFTYTWHEGWGVCLDGMVEITRRVFTPSGDLKKPVLDRWMTRFTSDVEHRVVEKAAAAFDNYNGARSGRPRTLHLAVLDAVMRLTWLRAYGALHNIDFTADDHIRRQ